MTSKEILKYMNDLKIKYLQNSIAAMSGQIIPYPELTEEYRKKEIEKERQTYMYGYGQSFQDDRELKAFQEGKLIM